SESPGGLFRAPGAALRGVREALPVLPEDPPRQVARSAAEAQRLPAADRHPPEGGLSQTDANAASRMATALSTSASLAMSGGDRRIVDAPHGSGRRPCSNAFSITACRSRGPGG